ncbi:MAG: Multisubunit Na+/H+ antiporter, MnhD subunit [Candidatus Saccharicenans subterraneus]|uniref:Multisubunit Na+/H+ antiporter, MnhD subunit n=1 Tax=Candidatus Saccharicenans subterraneus TaxID=2508984 RepID=A0A3E2BQ48_9BACT|nr:MAG: Multisubunit Na+/H+ antiporter, MnhD subunit [Candidatus Saccharicenans subterraneum]
MVFSFIVIPLLVAAFLPLVGKFSKKLLPDVLTNAALAFLVFNSILLVKPIFNQGVIVQNLNWLGERVNLQVALDGFNLFMLFTISLVSLCISLFSIDYLEHYGHKSTFYALFLVMIAGMNGLVLVPDLFSVYLFLEVAAVASYALVAFGLGYDELEASFKYLMLSVVASAFALLSITVIFGMTGSLNFQAVAQGLQDLQARLVLGVCVAFFIMGFGLKAALVPFHAWLPDAHPSAPAPISAMLSGLLIKVSGIYALFRIIYSVIGLTPALSQLLMALGTISMVVAALLALGQKDIKRMLAYSSISQVGYIVLGLALGTPLGIAGALFHLFNHAVAKGLLFLNSGSIQHITGTRNLEELGGLGKMVPVTAGTNLVGALSIAGVPPLAGFWSKLIIIMALIQAKEFGYALVAILASILTLWYYLLIQRKAFFGRVAEKWSQVREAPFWMSAANVVLALVCILVGIFFTPIFKTWISPAAEALARGIQQVLMWGL